MGGYLASGATEGTLPDEMPGNEYQIANRDSTLNDDSIVGGHPSLDSSIFNTSQIKVDMM